jgi:hypothetical protein
VLLLLIIFKKVSFAAISEKLILKYQSIYFSNMNFEAKFEIIMMVLA